jgi:hypothetical protein
MPLSIVFETTRFSEPNQSTPSGEEFVRWLAEHLKQHGVQFETAQKKQGGLEFGASHGAARYVVTAASPANPTGLWKISFEKRRGLGDQLFGKGKLAPTDPFVWLVENALQGEPDIKNVRKS